MSFIEITNLKKSYGDLKVLRDINLVVNKGDVIAIIGSSGSGKSTFLRCLINLSKFDDGTVSVDNNFLIKDGVYQSKSQIKEITSRMGMVFRNFNLFPHMSVKKNLITPYKLNLKNRINKKSKSNNIEISPEIKCHKLLEKVGLSDKIDVMPATLSGGQKQRVAIARALMEDPEILLFDEPTSALDPELTNEVLGTIKQLATEHMTMLVVTHEMSFARDVATKVVFMDKGVVIESGSPKEIFTNPKAERTKEFLKNALS